jgi:hypothetical protein
VGLSPDDIARLRGLVADHTFTARFDLEREIGAGGMGRVFIATDKATSRKIAIKLLDPGLHGDAVRFAAEAAILERLEHPAIVSYVAHGVTSDGRAYLAMTWLDGESLSARLERGPLATRDAVVLGARVAGALAYLHANGIVHRDIKPSNVFLVGGDPAAATVIDLGIAKQLNASEKLTRTGQLIGTPGYMAPEQVMGESTIDGRVDLFALGCLLHEALTGEMPFPGTAVMEVLAHLLLHEPKRLDTINPEIPARLATAVSILLAKEADDRTIDAAATAKELAAIADALAAGNAKALATSPFKRPVGGTEPTLNATPTARERPAPASPIAPPPKASRVALIAIAAPLAAVLAVGVLIFARSSSDPPAPSVVEKIIIAPSGPVALPSDADATRTPGPLATGLVVEGAAPELLGIEMVAGTWCRASRRAVTVAADGRVYAIPRTGPPSVLPGSVVAEPSNAKLVCLATGRTLLVAGAQAFAIEGDRVVEAHGMPATVVDGVVLGHGARWVVPGAVWEWDGVAPPNKLFDTCGDPTRLGPDGEHVACRSNGTITVEYRGRTEQGPTGQAARWSDDGSTLIINQGRSHVTWKLGTQPARTGEGMVGRIAVQVGPWLVSTPGKVLSRRSFGPGPTRAGSTRLHEDVFDILAVLTAEREVLVNTEGRLRFIAIERDDVPGPREPRPARIRALAFHPDGGAIAAVDEERAIVVRAIATAQRTSFVDRADLVSSSAWLTWRSDGMLVLGGSLMLDGWNAEGKRRKIAEGDADVHGVSSTTAQIAGTDDVARASKLGLEIVNVEGGIGRSLARTNLSDIRTLQVERTLRHALLETMRSARIVQLPSMSPVVAIAELHGERVIEEVALVGGEAPIMVLADSFGNVFAVGARGVRPLAKLAGPVQVMARPSGRQVAVATGREVIVFDVDSGAELVRGELETPISAIAWDRAGKRLAASGYANELQVFDVP